jgi:hypothetical protein
MTENQARVTANVVIAAAAIGAAVYVMRTPKLRRMAWQLARQYATGPLVAWTAGTVRGAWDASGAGLGTGQVIDASPASASRGIGPIS